MKRLTAVNTAKYLGVFLGELLQWNNQFAYVQIKLYCGIGILSKLRRNTNLKMLKIAYDPLSTSHLQYNAQLCGLANKKRQNQIQVIQNQGLRKIGFKKLHYPFEQLYKDFKISKLFNIVHLQNYLFMNKIE